VDDDRLQVAGRQLARPALDIGVAEAVEGEPRLPLARPLAVEDDDVRGARLAQRAGAQLAVLADPNGAAGPTGLAAVGEDGGVAMVMRNLAPTAGSQVYEAWLIGADQVPVAIGGFQVGGSGSASFVTAHAFLGEGVVVALTLEPQEGAKTPTMPILALGTARAAQSS